MPPHWASSGGIGARPEMIGQVSDGDGALAALTVALKLAEMHHNDDILEGDVIIGTHVCPDAPTIPHEPVPFMDSPIDMAAMNEQECAHGCRVVHRHHQGKPYYQR